MRSDQASPAHTPAACSNAPLHVPCYVRLAADMNVRDRAGRTPADLAAAFGQHALAEWLLQGKSDAKSVYAPKPAVGNELTC